VKIRQIRVIRIRFRTNWRGIKRHRFLENDADLANQSSYPMTDVELFECITANVVMCVSLHDITADF